MSPIIFFGSSEYSLPVLSRLLEKQIPIAAVVTTRDKPVGRHLTLTPNPVAQFSAKNHIPTHKSLKEFAINYEPITNNSYLIGLVAAYGKIIPQRILDLFNTQIYNIHPSLLPKYRGPSPLQQQILDGLSETGVTVIQLDAEMDHGPILAQETDVILPSDTPQTLGQRLFLKGTDMFIEKFLNQQPTTDNLQLLPQDHNLASYTKMLSRQDGFLPYDKFIQDLRTMNYELRTRFHAFYPWPGIWTTDPAGKRIKLVNLSPLMVQKEGQTPEPFTPDN